MQATRPELVLLRSNHSGLASGHLPAAYPVYSRTSLVLGPWHAVRHGCRMTVTEMTNTQTLFARAAASIARRNASVVASAGFGGSQTGSGENGSGQDGSNQDGGGQGSGGTFDTAMAKTAPASQNAAAAKSKKPTGDTVELSAGLTDAQASPVELQPFAGLVEQFVRTRSAVSFTIPGHGGFGSMSFAFEVETAYRVVRPLSPGEVVNVQA